MKKRTIVSLCCTAFLLCATVVAVLFYHGILLFNNPSQDAYPVRGVDVSSYQGEINWDILAGENIQFAFIKATEGSGYTDEYYQTNYERAKETGLRIGAYHFFSFDSPGKTQAENFIAAVAKTDNMLPPVADVEFYGEQEANPPDAGALRQELFDFMNILEEYYGKKPIIYATPKSYDLYIAGYFEEYDIWIRNVLTRPSLSDGRSWTFWQYTNREKLNGYDGKEKYIDMNVFCGGPEAFAAYG